jgi:hypothetical protein
MNNLLKKSDYFILSSSLFSMIISIGYWFSGFQDVGLFIGMWVPSILGFGIYFKILTQNRQE